MKISCNTVLYVRYLLLAKGTERHYCFYYIIITFWSPLPPGAGGRSRQSWLPWSHRPAWQPEIHHQWKPYIITNGNSSKIRWLMLACISTRILFHCAISELELAFTHLNIQAEILITPRLSWFHLINGVDQINWTTVTEDQSSDLRLMGRALRKLLASLSIRHIAYQCGDGRW